MPRELLDPKTRESMLATEDNTCPICSTTLPYVLRVHHKLAVHLGGTDHEQNLIPLCANCHSLTHWYSHPDRLVNLERENATFSAKQIGTLKSLCAELAQYSMSATKTNTAGKRRPCTVCEVDHPRVIQSHHIVPREYGGGDDCDNRIDLCGNCHILVHRYGAKNRLRRMHKELKAAPWPDTWIEEVGRLAGAILRAQEETAERGGLVAEPGDLPQMIDAIESCAKKLKMDEAATAMLALRLMVLLGRIPEELRERCSYALTHQGGSVSVNMGNNLIFRAPVRLMDAEHRLDGAFITLSNSFFRENPGFVPGFEFVNFDASMLLLPDEFFIEFPWESAYREGCYLAAEAPKTRARRTNFWVSWSAVDEFMEKFDAAEDEE